MITAKIDWTRLPWKEELRNNVTSVEQLRGYIDLSEREAREIADVIRQFPVNIPRYYLSLIDQADPNDPIKKMCFPSMEELVVAGSMGETTRDPYGDDKHDKGNGVLQKYDYSVLIVTTESCAMFCRHCFRRRIVGRKTDHILQNFEAAVEYVASHPDVTNVILSGGDPLMLPTPLLRTLLMALAEIEHLGFVRIGSRTPVTYPCRIFDDELIELFTEFSSKKTLYLPTHFNHVKEITPAAAEAVRRLRMAGVTVNNQAVLLRGVNDRPEDLKALMDGLLRIGVNPYYLYQCMPVSGVSHHFQVPLKQAVEIVDEARSGMDGYAKRFKFILGHDIGKLEVCGLLDGKLVLKQIHARSGHKAQASRLILQEIGDGDGWVSLE
ncbi:MAG: L-lysine 2,3-aminomutase [Verrucomicrobia bacterium ADurb.Bin122]|nr:MAG: L-lysine 2,3-aminomutase [Verrucomicrobia bacterium ADurb.Bin122]HOD46553.1 KamA family radical SAM protein [Opitutaceae bacterium]HOY54628.1 KamA family radical SAM protein [Opitutaceae bacterium]HPG16873.1 KamA family radical SAM protein [Opitutaceae bacterium]HQL21907.1 KamA family radical SAM protein [Opitutaceae bacterium]